MIFCKNFWNFALQELIDHCICGLRTTANHCFELLPSDLLLLEDKADDIKINRIYV